jgi:hypothetical protein
MRWESPENTGRFHFVPVFTRSPKQVEEDDDDSTKAYTQYAAGGRRSLTMRCAGNPP